MTVAVEDRREVTSTRGSGVATCNIAQRLSALAVQQPDCAAVIVPRGRDHAGRAIYARWTFADLEAYSNRCANGLISAGLEPGMRVLVMVRPGLDFIALTFALFKMGAVPVMIDPGMGLNRLLACVRNAAPEALIGVSLAQAARVLRPGPFRTVRRTVTVGRRWFWGGPTLTGLTREADSKFTPVDTRPDEVAAILFTSGATGPPKGVVYEHGIFDAQARWIQAHYGIQPGEIDLATFPLFALFGPAMGMTCVIPEMDPTRPARADPGKIVEAIRDHSATSTFGSPALWDRVSVYCVERGITLPTLRRVLIAGAPVSWRIVERLRQVLAPGADVHTPYGATESLPVASISGSELRDGCQERTCAGAGTCVGRPMPGITQRFIRVRDDPIETWSDELLVPDGQIGEIVVAGEVVTREYLNLPHATAGAKIHDGERTWHRIGDVGYRDGQGRVWFCGRKAHRVVTARDTLYSVRCEGVFNAHPDVHRCALVGVGEPGEARPVLVVEPVAGKFPRGPRRETFKRELLELGAACELTREVREVLFRRSLPVDVRHNAKIDREALAVWAAGRLV